MGLKGTALAICVLIGATGLSPVAEAARPDRNQSQASSRVPQTMALPARAAAPQFRLNTVGSARAQGRNMSRRGYAASYGGISCVPYARQATGMHISGNGWQWWGNAAGSYARGHRPEPGSVLAFRSTGNMRHGHVAVVSQVITPRAVLIDHANWGGPGIRRGSVMHGVQVQDVSPNNDWSDVRVQIGHSAESFGRTYPTYGFIYNRPDTGRYLAEGGETQPSFEEVAEAPEPTNAPRAGQRNTSQRRNAAPARRTR